ncbi:MAG: hypothetical protein SV765_04240 [Pseudomonadota bacterium]|nr:hypothetical protein [Pseudomonadota bacterium]
MIAELKSESSRDIVFLQAILACFIVSFLFSLFQSSFFDYGFRPDEFKSVYKWGIEQYINVELYELVIRILLYFVTASMLLILAFAKWITPKTAALAAVWPLYIFLCTKIYFEFWIFPLALIRWDLSRSSNINFIFALALLFFITVEGNLLIILLLRIVCLFEGKARVLISALLAATSVTLSWLMESGIAQGFPVIGHYLVRFNYTREIVNPEYSIFETIGVFTASMHFFTLHIHNYYIDIFFSLIVCIYILLEGQFSKSILMDVFTFTCILLFFTEITHAFQNARYYMFYLPVIGSIIRYRSLYGLAILGWLHLIVKAAFVNDVF